MKSFQIINIKFKHMKRNILLYAIMGFFLLSCSEDFLDRPPQDAITIDNYYKTVDQINAATGLLYGWPWFTLNDKAHWTIGDSRAGNDWTNDGGMAQFFTFSVVPSNAHLGEAWTSLWQVVAHANAVINEIPARAPSDIPKSVTDRAVAEGLFMRATAYFYLVRLWGGVPIILNNSDAVNNPKVPRNKVEDVYTLIIRDLERAIPLLPPTPFSSGRITSWAAKGMLAKVHLTYAGYNQSGTRNQEHLTKARTLAEDVVKNSGLTLFPSYADLFKFENQERVQGEVLFAFQWISCQGWGTQNTNQAYWAASGTLTGAGDGWGGYKGPTIDLQNEYEAGDLRRQSTFMINGDVYPELQKAAGGYKHVIEQNSPGPTMANIKKYVIGTAADNGGPGKVCFMSTGMNTNVLRLADVYLIYAEAILGNNATTTDADALSAFNAIRGRAGLTPKNSITWEDIRKERRLELAYEAEYWYDIVRWYYYNPQGAMNHINNQERGNYYWDADAQELKLDSKRFTVSASSFFLPMPQGDADKNPLLLQDPVPYNWGN
jgi:starch-binding outer membrane protein, SusD/RagB family